jgi:outer membrane murein-binding lipoprotein Lpp
VPFRMKNTDVLFISLVPAGANKRQVVFKAAGVDEAGRVFDRDFAVRKADDTRQIVYGIAYPVGDAHNLDTQGDFADAQEVERMAYAFMAKGRSAYGVDRDHSYRALEKAFVAESWLVRKGDPIFGAPEDEGAWAVGIKIAEQALYDELKKTGYRGLSIAGTCEREEIAKSETKTAGDEGGWLAKWRRLLRKEDTVDELKKALEETAGLVKTLTERVAKLEKGKSEDAPADDAAPDAQAEVAKLAGQVKDLSAKLAKLEAGEGEGDKGDDDAAGELAKAVKTLAERVAKLEKTSPGSAQTDPPAPTEKRGLGLL